MNPKEIHERLTDVQEMVMDLEERITDLEKREPVPAEHVDIGPVLNELQLLRQMFSHLQEEYQSYFQQKPSITKNFRFLFFPDRNPKLYYTIVFGRLLPWGTLLAAVISVAILGSKGLALCDHKLQTDEDQHYQKAWQYLEQHVSPKTINAMDDAWEKTK
jgi:hypothetical protein